MGTFTKTQAGNDIDRRTGMLISGWASVVQSLEVIFTTNFGERVEREYFGSWVPVMLGREIITPGSTLRFWTAIWTAIDRFEPRYTDNSVQPTSLTREGQLSFIIDGKFRPRALSGDYEPEGSRRVLFSISKATGGFVSLEAMG